MKSYEIQPYVTIAWRHCHEFTSWNQIRGPAPSAIIPPKPQSFHGIPTYLQISIQSWGTSYHPRFFWMTILLLKQPWFFPWSLGDHDVPARLRRPWRPGQVASCCRFCGINFSTHDLKYGSHPRSGGSKYTWRQRRTKGHDFRYLKWRDSTIYKDYKAIFRGHLHIAHMPCISWVAPIVGSWNRHWNLGLKNHHHHLHHLQNPPKCLINPPNTMHQNISNILQKTLLKAVHICPLRAFLVDLHA